MEEPDPAVRAQLLAQSLAEDAELVDPTSGRFNGRDAINERIAGFSARFPGAQLTLTSGADEAQRLCAIRLGDQRR